MFAVISINWVYVLMLLVNYNIHGSRCFWNLYWEIRWFIGLTLVLENWLGPHDCPPCWRIQLGLLSLEYCSWQWSSSWQNEARQFIFIANLHEWRIMCEVSCTVMCHFISILQSSVYISEFLALFNSCEYYTQKNDMN